MFIKLVKSITKVQETNKYYTAYFTLFWKPKVSKGDDGQKKIVEKKFSLNITLKITPLFPTDPPPRGPKLNHDVLKNLNMEVLKEKCSVGL